MVSQTDTRQFIQEWRKKNIEEVEEKSMTKKQRIETLIATHKISAPSEQLLKSFIRSICAIWELEEEGINEY